MIARLYRAFERQVGEVEARLAEAGAAVDDKDARTLGTLARTLEKLIELQTGRAGEGEAAEAVDLAELRAEIARRLDRLGGAS